MELIRQLPDEASTETIVGELEFKLLIECRLDAVDRGEVVSHAEAKKRLANWLDLPGR